MTAEPVPGRWQGFLRFSVRELIVLVLVIGAGLGWVVRGARIQRDAVAAIENAGGRVAYDWQWRNGKSVQRGMPWAPTWLANLIGVDYFGHVTAVILHGATDAAIVQVGRLTQLQRLDLEGGSISDASLSRLNGLTKLSKLDLSNSRVSDAGVNELQQTLSRLTIVRWFDVRPSLE